MGKGTGDENNVSKNSFLDANGQLKAEIDPVINADGFQDEINKFLQSQYNYLTIVCKLNPSEAKQELEQFWNAEKVKELFPSVPPEQQETITNQVTTAIADGSYNPVIEAQQKYMAAVQAAEMRVATANGMIGGINAVIAQFVAVHPYLANMFGLDAGLKNPLQVGYIKVEDDPDVDAARKAYEAARDKANSQKGGKNGLNTDVATTRPRGNGTSYTTPQGRTDTSGSSSSSSKEKTPWENPYDRLYNLTQKSTPKFVSVIVSSPNTTVSSNMVLAMLPISPRKPSKNANPSNNKKLSNNNFLLSAKRMLKSSTRINTPNMLAMIWQRVTLSLIIIL